MTADELIAMLRDWRERFYGDLDTYEGGERHMTQLDHGHEEYEARMDLVAALDAASQADAERSVD